MSKALPASPSARPRRAAAENALYKPCPTCERKFLVTEIEFHANLCIQKLERKTGTTVSPTKKHSLQSTTKFFPLESSEKIAHRRQVFQNIPGAPIFYPTEEEFKDPLKFIAKIRPHAQQYGICKIVAPFNRPGGWIEQTFDEVVQPESYFFQTKVQNIRELSRRGQADAFYCNLAEFMQKNNKTLTAIPRLAGKRVPLYQLFSKVGSLGGFDSVEKNHLWPQIANELHFPESPTSIPDSLRMIYQQNLYLYEQSEEAKRFEETHPTPTPQTKSFAHAPGMRAVKLNLNPKNNSTAAGEDGGEDSSNSFGFDSGRVYSLSGFKKIANRFARKYFQIPRGAPLEIPETRAEAEFWDIVDFAEDDCIVQYGSDLDVKSHGSGFPDHSSSPWDLKSLPTLSDSLLKYLPEHISGITIPMMYIGMLFSAFCWHTEDDYLYSINYLHTGAAKTWYGVGSDHCAQFERVMKDALPDLFEHQPDLLHHLTTMISPVDLVENRVPVYRLIQRPGEFVVTFPQGYHGGFNGGFNVAEAVNFASPDWLPFGRLCVKNYKLVKRTHIFSNHELVFNAVQREGNLTALKWLTEELKIIRLEEHSIRERLLATDDRTDGDRDGGSLQEKDSDSKMNLKFQDWETIASAPNAKPCSMCNIELYFSAVSCSCKPGLIYACVDHAKTFCKCSSESKMVLIRHSLEKIDQVLLNAEQMLESKLCNVKRILPDSVFENDPVAKRHCGAMFAPL